MSTTLEAPAKAVSVPTQSAAPRTRPVSTRILHLLRRGHLYLGLGLFPWAILYGVTAFLFNHPSVFSDAPVISFAPADLKGTLLEKPPSPTEQATALLVALNEKQTQPAKPFILGTGEVRYASRDSFIATVNAGGAILSHRLRTSDWERDDS